MSFYLQLQYFLLVLLDVPLLVVAESVVRLAAVILITPLLLRSHYTHALLVRYRDYSQVIFEVYANYKKN